MQSFTKSDVTYYVFCHFNTKKEKSTNLYKGVVSLLLLAELDAFIVQIYVLEIFF